MLSGIVYLSEAKVPFSENDLIELAVLSQAKNRSLGITGYLYYGGGHFAQYVEGEHELVMGLMRTIRDDKRHIVRDEFLERDLVTRRFPQWSMRNVRLNELQQLVDENHIEDFIERNLFLVRKDTWNASVRNKLLWCQVEYVAAAQKFLGAIKP